MGQIALERRDDFTGGLNLRADQFQLLNNESPDMLNVEVDPRGGVFSRGAMLRINTTAVAGTWSPQKLYPFYGTTAHIMLSNASTVYKSVGADFSYLDQSAGVPLVVSNADGASLAAWGGSLYVACGVTTAIPRKWASTADTYTTALAANGPTWQASGAPIGGYYPRAEHNIVHTNKMFVANTYEDGTAYPDRVRWSHEGLPEDWVSTDYIDIKAGGSGINGLATVAGQLVIFKQNAIFLLIGTASTNFKLVELSSKLGVLSRNSIAVSEQGVFFYSVPEGLFFYDGSSIHDIFDALRPIVDAKELSVASTEPFSVSWVGRRLWLSLPHDTALVATAPTVSYVFDYTIGQNGTWMKFSTHDSKGVVGGIDYVDVNGNNLRLFCHPTQAYVLKVDEYLTEKDNISGTSTAFDSYYRTGWVSGKTYAQKKMFRRPDIAVKQADTARDIAVKVHHNFEESAGSERKSFVIALTASATGGAWGSAVWGTSTWGVVAQGTQIKRGSALGLARAVQLLFTGPIGQKWGFDSIAFKYNNRRMTG